MIVCNRIQEGTSLGKFATALMIGSFSNLKRSDGTACLKHETCRAVNTLDRTVLAQLSDKLQCIENYSNKQ